ncbi:uncharacterized protein METZ01_LOCUS103444 [marine metagenome]|uniref:Uncharacterized protein n=1 Tax=marine metagenome TaxID=408172 RepID=A0A381WDJ0_9ZZZZ
MRSKFVLISVFPLMLYTETYIQK